MTIICFPSAILFDVKIERKVEFFPGGRNLLLFELKLAYLSNSCHLSLLLSSSLICDVFIDTMPRIIIISTLSSMIQAIWKFACTIQQFNHVAYYSTIISLLLLYTYSMSTMQVFMDSVQYVAMFIT